MSHKKEILELESQAKQHEIRARELYERTNILRYQDMLESIGWKHEEKVREIKTGKIGIVESYSNVGCFIIRLLRKDGTKSAFTKHFWYGQLDVKAKWEKVN